MKEIALEGIDNVGKSSVATCIANLLHKDGKRVHIAAPFHESGVSGEELYELCTQDIEGARLAMKLVRNGIETSRNMATNNNADYLLFDRHWMTAKMMAPLIDLEDKGYKPPTVLLVPGNRKLQDMTDDEPWSTVEQLDHYQKAYRQLARDNLSIILGIYVIEVPASDIVRVAETILWDERILR